LLNCPIKGGNDSTGIGLLTSDFEFQLVKKVIELPGGTMINGTDFNIRTSLY
tara:strand:+ start:118 stop:273 length:156 start_codon:yes stop_codon:yes gene_type:complete